MLWAPFDSLKIGRYINNMWRLCYFLLLTGLCFAQNEDKTNVPTENVPNAEISSTEGSSLNNQEFMTPSEENKKDELTNQEIKIDEIITVPSDGVPPSPIELANPPEIISQPEATLNSEEIPSNLTEAPIQPPPKDILTPTEIPLTPIEEANLPEIQTPPKEIPTPSEIPPAPIEMANIPEFQPQPTPEEPQNIEVILVSGEPVPIAIESNNVIPVAILAPENVFLPENTICQKRNSYYKVDGSCDAYIECREFMSRDMLCPDGMHFNPDAKWPEYPCGYPMDVSCTGRGAPQEANPTEFCPHRYGFYPPLEINPNECGRYRMCVDGNSIDMMCPPGLAFNPEMNRCDWPENVTSCDAEAFLGFKCPPHPVDARGKPLNVVLNFKHEKDCHVFFSCKEGRARLLSCDIGFAFDPIVGKCVDSELVSCLYDAKNDPRKTFF